MVVLVYWMGSFLRDQELQITPEELISLERQKTLVVDFLKWCSTKQSVASEEGGDESDCQMSVLKLDLHLVSNFLVCRWLGQASTANHGPAVDVLQTCVLASFGRTLSPGRGASVSGITEKLEYCKNLMHFTVLKNYSWDFKLKALWLRNVSACLTETGFKGGRYVHNDVFAEGIVGSVKGGEGSGGTASEHQICHRQITVPAREAVLRNIRPATSESLKPPP